MQKTTRTRLSAGMVASGRGARALGSLLLALLLPASALGQVGNTFIYVGSQFQSYTVPATGWYFLDAQGAQGGAASNGSHQGGKGAWMQGYAYLQQGAVLRIAVGGAGRIGKGDGNNVSGGGGGGGSSIVLTSGSVTTPSSSDIPLLIAGGGGGAGANYNGSSGLTTERAGPPNEGVDGKGAGVGSDFYGGAGGAGYLTDGGTHHDGDASKPVLSQGGYAYLSGNNGGGSSNGGGNGGWGGGGQGGPAVSSVTKNRDGAGGGGGGFSGGGGGANQGDGAGGGGSFVAGVMNTTLSVAVRGYRSGDGVVTITPVSGPPVITQPANQKVAIGQPVTLGPVFNDPTGQTTYQWMKDGVLLVGQTSATLAIASFQFTDAGGYQAIVQQGAATSITLPAFLSPSTPLSTLQAWAANGYGQLGIGTNVYKRIFPVQVTNDVSVVASGRFHSLFVKSDGTLWAMGMNDSGQLGIGKGNDRDWHYSPVYVASDVVAVTAGRYHSLFVTRDGALWAMGRNQEGQLGIGNTDDQYFPVKVASGVVAVAAGYTHSLFVTRDGTLWAMGGNESGQLGIGNKDGQHSSPVPVTIDVVAVAAATSNGTGGDSGLSGYSLYVTRDGTLWGMGDDSNGQLGVEGGDGGKFYSPAWIAGDVVAVAAGLGHTLFVKRDGRLWGMGKNQSGQLGVDIETLNIDNTKWYPVPVASNVVAVAAGAYYSLFVKRDGTLWAMGDDDVGQLGDAGWVSPQSSPVQVFFRDLYGNITTPLIVASLPKMPFAEHTLAVTAPAPVTLQSGSPPRQQILDEISCGRVQWTRDGDRRLERFDAVCR